MGGRNAKEIVATKSHKESREKNENGLSFLWCFVALVAGDVKTLANGPGDPFYVVARTRSYLEVTLIVC